MYFGLCHPKIAAPAKVMAVVAVEHPFRKLQRLIPAHRRSCVIQRREIGERQIRQTPIEGVLRNTCDAEESRSLDVLLECIQIPCRRAVAAVLNVERIVGTAKRPNVPERRLDARPRIDPAYGWERVANHAIR